MFRLRFFPDELPFFEGGLNPEDPVDYVEYRYLGADTWLVVPGDTNKIRRMEYYSRVKLPPSWGWTLRALGDNRLEAIA